MDRAFPGWAIDLIRDGVPAKDLKSRGTRAVWSALVRTAASAQTRGQDRVEWEFLILDPASRLGTQVRLKDGQKARTRKAIAKTLTDAWDAAWEWRTEQDAPWDREQVATKAHERAAFVLDLVADADADLNDRERAVMAHAAQETQRRGMLRVALPWRSVMGATGLSERITKATLERLQERGLLHLEVPGRRGANGGKANLYALPTAERLTPSMCRGTRPMGPPHHTYGTSADPAPMGPAPDLWDLPISTTSPSTADQENDMTASLTLNLTPAEQAAVLETLARVRAAETAADQATDARVIAMRPSGT